MKAVELDQPLQDEALREIERSLFGKLRAHRVSDAFLDRCGEDAIQRGLLEYLRALQAGKEIENRDAFIVRAAFCRAIDELRREARQLDGAVVEGLLNMGREAAPASEELAIEHVEAQELHEAIGQLPIEERQVLALHYFDGLSAKRSAEVLYLSEATYRRRLKRAVALLGERLGVAAPDPSSEPALEIGLAAWASLGGGQVALARGPLDQLMAVLARSREGLAWVSARLRDPLARADASGATEKVGALGSGPAGKVLGGCAAATIACVVGGVVGPGIAHHAAQQPPSPGRAGAQGIARPTPPTDPAFETPLPLGMSRSESSAPGTETSSASGARQPKPHRSSEGQRVEKQVSGFARAEAEASPPAEAEASAAEPVVTVSPGAGGATSSEPAEKEFGFEGQP